MELRKTVSFKEQIMPKDDYNITKAKCAFWLANSASTADSRGAQHLNAKPYPILFFFYHNIKDNKINICLKN